MDTNQTTPPDESAPQAFHAGSCSALELFDADTEALRTKAELQMLCRLRIGSRVAVRFASEMNEKFRMVPCEPYTLIGEVWGLQRHKNQGWVDILFEGDQKPTSAFRALEVMLIEPSSKSPGPELGDLEPPA